MALFKSKRKKQAEALVEKAVTLASQGNLKSALESYMEAQEMCASKSTERSIQEITSADSQHSLVKESLIAFNEPHADLSIIKMGNAGLEKEIHQLRTEVLDGMDEEDKDVFSVRREENRLVFVLGERITFRAGKASLLSAYRSISKKIAGFIITKKDYQVVISGHTDNRPIHTKKFPSNLDSYAGQII